MPSQQIWFGILHFMGSAMLLFALLDPLLSRVSTGLESVCALAYSFSSTGVEWGVLGFQACGRLPCPKGFTTIGWLFPLRFLCPGLFQRRLLPALTLDLCLLAGSYVGIPLRDSGAHPGVTHPQPRPPPGVGRHAILIYLLHQPILFVCFQLLIRLVGWAQNDRKTAPRYHGAVFLAAVGGMMALIRE